MTNSFVKPTMIYMSPLATRSGYGDHALDVGKSLLKYGKYDIKFVLTPWGGCPSTLKPEEAPEIFSKILNSPLQQPPETFMQMTIPNEFQTVGKYNIGFTAGIETTICRGEWIDGINKMNLILVPSVHSKEVFLNTKMTKKNPNGTTEPIECKVPIEVLFEGADTDVFKKTSDIPEKLNKQLSSIEEDFCFLFVGHWMNAELGHDRKDVGMMIKTFLDVFKNTKKKPALVLKTSNATLSTIDRNEILSKISEIRNFCGGGSNLPNIYLIHGNLTREEMNGLYNHPKIKAHLSFSHGEGFGRPLLEASFSEKPILSSKWGGVLDFLNPNYAVLIGGDVKNVHPSAVNDWIIKESSWFYISYSEAAQKMEDVFKNYEDYLPAAKALGRENKEKFSMKAMDTKFYEILDKYIPDFPKQAIINLPKQHNDIGSHLNVTSLELPTLSKA
jgi:glycosyltransferase involved in cell wall biosynthesis